MTSVQAAVQYTFFMQVAIHYNDFEQAAVYNNDLHSVIPFPPMTNLQKMTLKGNGI